MLTPLSMQLIQLAPGELNWDLNFNPKISWPKAMPIVAARTNSLPLVITGFERQNEKDMQVLVLDEPVEALCAALWPQLMGGGQNSLETLRLKSRLHAVLRTNSNFEAETKELIDFLVTLPVELQNFFDERQMGLKNLKPLVFLKEWLDSTTKAFLNLKPTSSQTRELIDLLCDLKMLGHDWSKVGLDLSIKTSDQWLARLRFLRAPKTLSSDEKTQYELSKMPWPRGVKARWERQGDQAGVNLQSRFINRQEWERFKAIVEKLSLEDLWS